MDNDKLVALVLTFIALVAAAFVIYQLQVVLLPFVLALFLSTMFQPIIQFLRKRRIPQAICILVVLLIAGGVLLLLAGVAFSGIDAMVRAAPLYEQRLDKYVRVVVTSIESARRSMGEQGQPLNLRESIPISAITGFFLSGVGSFISFVGTLVMVLLFLVFLLSGSEGFPEKLRHAFSTERSLKLGEVVAQINLQVRRYITAKAAVSAMAAIVVTIILLLFGVDFALFLGLLAFVLNFIPNVGSFIATVLPTLIALLQFESFGIALSIAGIIIVVQNVIGNVIEPRIMGRTLDLSPLLVLVSLIFWGWLWGIWGMVLAVPVTATLKIICENITDLRPIAVMMSSGSARKGKPRT